MLHLVPPPPAPGPVPVLTWGGHRVLWDRWETAPQILCPKARAACESCQWDGPVSIARGRVQYPEATVEVTVPTRKRRPGETRKWATVHRVQPARQVAALMAFYCPRCGRVDVLHLDDASVEAASALLCDGCDQLAAAGATLDEARATLVALGGWTAGGDADWDLCPACNPATDPAANPRAVLARRAPTGEG